MSEQQAMKSVIYLPAVEGSERAAEAAREAGAQVVWRGSMVGQRGDWQRVRRDDGLDEVSAQTVVLAADHGLALVEMTERIGALVARGRRVVVEVVDVDGAKQAVRAGASALVATGFEAGGVVGEESGLVLLRRLFGEVDVPILVRGAIGPDSAAAVAAAGASGWVLEEQMWLCPEFDLDDKVERRLKALSPTDTRCLGVTLGFRFRVFAMIASRKPKALASREVEYVEEGWEPPGLLAEIQEAEPAHPYAVDLRDEVWSAGQGAAMAAELAERFGDVAGVIEGIEAAVEKRLRSLREDFPLAEGRGIAEVNGTQWPIHQGPMAQVSDVPEFARAVADAGALPWLALANMPTHIAEEMVDATVAKMDDEPWGAGIIGLDANRYRDGHMEMLKEKRRQGPMLGLVAAGTAEQAMRFESASIPTYLHTPTPGVLRAALRSGHRRFLLEGSEAGGHVGNLGGLALWQYGVWELESAMEDGVDPSELAVVPAGGICDRPSAAAVAALFGGLVERGVAFGIQMGTAYLMTKEAVETGAIKETYQAVASESQGTVIMGESVNTPTRVLRNGAADEVLGREKERLTDGVKLGERKHLYERDNLGGLRAAAKGQRIAEVDPEKGAIFEDLSEEEQRREGLYHCGQGVTLCQPGMAMNDLHRAVTEGAHQWVRSIDDRRPEWRDSSSAKTHQRVAMERSQSGSAREIIDGDKAVAIIGIGAKMPGALSAQSFWTNIVEGRSSITEVPEDRWSPSLYYDANRSAPDKTYSKIGGWVTGFEFDRRSYRLPPKVVESIDPTQLLCLEAVKEALEDAGYLEADFDRDRCAVILGNALGGDLRDTTNQRILYPEVDQVLRKTLLELGGDALSAERREALLDEVETRFKEQIVGINEDSMPGELANIVAGRVAQTFDLRGPNFICDAACASSLAALEAAVRGIRDGQFDMAVTGGADRSMGAPSFVKFSKIGALSADGSRPFDADANGFVMGEGAGIVILKRLSQAIEDGDDIYAVVRGVGGSSDGRGKGITAPNPRGQKLAMRRAYEDAGFGAKTVSMIEAHGTSTPVGDPAEVGSIKAVLDADGSSLQADKIALGSVKSNIGHLKSAAGAAGVIKVAMALKHKLLPPTLNVERPNPKLGIEEGPLEIQRQAEPWTVRDGGIRRAGVSAFGFGGTNFHVVLEEYGSAGGVKGRGFGDGQSVVTTGGGGLRCKVPQGEGIVALTADDEAGLAEEFEGFKAAWERGGWEAIEPWVLPFSEPSDDADGALRLAIAVSQDDDLDAILGRVERALAGRMSWRVLSNQGVVLAREDRDGELAMLFPGQGTQYLGMLSELRERFSVVAETFDEADRIMEPVIGKRLSEIIDPDLDKVDQNKAFRELTRTEITQPAVLTADIALFRLMQSLGMDPAMVAGHSLGEYGACVAAGVMSFEEALLTVAARGTEMANATPMNGDSGLMAGISAPVEVVQPVLDEVDGYVVCANINCPGQTIIAGLTDAVKEAKARFEAMDYKVPLLPVSHAFHSKVVAEASEPLRRHLEGVEIQRPEIPILTNVTGDFYPQGAEAIRDLLAKQVASPVRYIDLVEEMYDRGVRVFVEVGPKRAQTSFVNNILEGREHLAMYSNHPKKGGVKTLYEALASLWAHGIWSERKTSREMTVEETEMAQNKDNVAPKERIGGADRGQIMDAMMAVLCEKTGYDPAEIEVDFELEADLGVDTVKQAEIMAEVREEFELERDEEFRLADYPTLERMADYVEEQLGGAGAPEEAVEKGVENASVAAEMASAKDDVAPKERIGGADRGQIMDAMMAVLCEKTGYDPAEIEVDFELEADLGVDTVKQAEIMAEVREEFELERDEEFRLADYPTLERMADYVEEQLGGAGAPVQEVATAVEKAVDSPVERGVENGVEREPETAVVAAEMASEKDDVAPWERIGGVGDSHDIEADAVISGCAVGLPGTGELFAEDTVQRLLEGENFIGELEEELKRSMVEKGITRLQKHEDGGGELVAVESTEEVIKLAGQSGSFDLGDWGVSSRLIEAMDRTSQLAFAAGFEALRDAGLPLVPRYRETRSGKKVTIGWTLPEEVGRETGVIFASAFAGQDALIEELKASQEADYQFNHRFLLRVLGIANSRFAEYVGARGPNTKINNACASTTTAIGIAEDWIRAGRCKRVIILSADDASGDQLMEWVGSGFLATGAATTKQDVSEAALPFDRRRHGMIVGMGALSLVVEDGALPAQRGIEPIADILATHFVNSAHHPTRLDVDHIAGEVSTLMERAESRFEVNREEIADKTAFISHETYTPARGGSAAAEIEALRRTFGDVANDVVIANTKGFTGHAMGAGIEDVLAMKVLQHEQVPPIANFKEPDPQLGDLRLSQGGSYDVDYALRLAAGFGSQLALALFRHRARSEDRIYDADVYGAWLSKVSGFEYPELTVEDRVLRLRQGQPEDEPPGGGIDPRQREVGNFEYQQVRPQPMMASSAQQTLNREHLQGRKVALFTEEESSASRRLQAVMEEAGAQCEVVLCQGSLQAALEGVEQAFDDGDIQGVVNLLGYGGGGDVYRVGRISFAMAKGFDGCAGGEFFLSVVQQGGHLGLDDESRPTAVQGAVAGMTKGCFQEWPQRAVRLVDVEQGAMSADKAQSVLTALFMEYRWPELGLSQGMVVEPVFEQWDRQAASFDKELGGDDVLVVTGGAKGIGAEICVDLAQRFGCKLALVGRSEMTHDAPLSVDMEQAKEQVRQKLKKRGERVTPVAVRDALWPLKSQRTVARNMERIQEAGSEVTYVSCDVSDGEAVKAMVAEVEERLGAVSGVIHGAGVEESKMLADKDERSFDKVFRGKVLGAKHLWEALRDRELRCFVGFASVAGRFGNEGQVDYSAANQAMANLCATIDRGDNPTQGLCIDWTAWGEVGMASEGSMPTILEARGVEFLPPEVGAPMVGDALEAGLGGEVMVAGELGEMGADLLGDVAPRVPQEVDMASFAMIDEVIERSAARLVAERVIDMDRDRFMADHVYEGTPIVPGVMGFEMMVQAAQLLTGKPHVEVEGASFDRAIKVYRGEPVRLTAEATRVNRKGSADSVDVVVRSHRKSRTGRMLKKEHFRARVHCDGRDVERPATFEVDPTTARQGPGRGAIYERFFHTGSFQVLASVPMVGEDFVVGRGRMPGHRLVEGEVGVVTEPLVREMALQTAGLWGMVHRELSYLPRGIEKSVAFGKAHPGQEVVIRAKRCSALDGEHTLVFDVEVRDAAGALLHWMEGVELIGHQRLREGQGFDGLPKRGPFSLEMNEGEAQRWAREMFDQDARALLSDEERQALERLRSRQRQGEFVAARMAARRLSLRWLSEVRGRETDVLVLSVKKAESGKPSMVLESEQGPSVSWPDLAITHTGGIAEAMLSVDRAVSVGVDREMIEERSAGFARHYFTPEERSLHWPTSARSLDESGRLTAMWAVKEAVSKALGLGLELSTEEIEILSIGGRRGDGAWPVEVELRGRAREALRTEGGGTLGAVISLIGGEIRAVAWRDGRRPTPLRWQQGEAEKPVEQGINGSGRGAHGHRLGAGRARAREAVATLLGHRKETGREPSSWTF